MAEVPISRSPWWIALTAAGLLATLPSRAQDADTVPTVAADPVQPAEGPPPTPTAATTRLLGEIVVTARRKVEDAQEVPISVNVLDATAIAEKNITNANDLAQSSPGLSATSFVSRSNTIFSIRGQGLVFQAGQPGVVPYYAEVADFSSLYYDLSNIQVLKGPQGTLFGRNTTGGAVLLTPQKPTDEWSGYLLGRGGNYSRADFEGAFGGPLLGETLTFRVAGLMLHRRGFTRDLEQDRWLDDENRDSIRVSLTWRPFESLESTTMFQRDHIDENGTGSVFSHFRSEECWPLACANSPTDAATVAHFLELGSYLQEQEAMGPRRVRHDGLDRYVLKKWGFINATTWNLSDAVAMKVIGSWYHGGDKTDDLDYDGSPYRVLQVTRHYKPNRGGTVELQLQYDDHETLSGVFGGYYERKIRDHADVSVLHLALTSAGIPFGTQLTEEFSASSAAVFAQGTWKFLDTWSLTLGARNTWDRRDSFAANFLFIGPEPETTNLEPLPTATRLHLDADAYTWTVALNDQITDDIMAYATMRRGYKAGGFGTPEAIGGGTDGLIYKPEFVLSREIGLKSEFAIGSMEARLNVDVFYDDYKDIQRYTFLPTLGGDNGLTFHSPNNVIRNAAKGTIAGFESDLLVAPSSWFDATVQYTYIHTKYDEYVDPDYGDLSDGRFPGVATHQVGVTPALHLPLPGIWGTLSAQTTFYYQSKIATEVNNVPNDNPNNNAAVIGSVKPGYHRWDARLDWRDIAGLPLSAGLYVRNIENDAYDIGGANTLQAQIIGVSSSIYGQPRLVSLELRYDF